MSVPVRSACRNLAQKVNMTDTLNRPESRLPGVIQLSQDGSGLLDTRQLDPIAPESSQTPFRARQRVYPRRLRSRPKSKTVQVKHAVGYTLTLDRSDVRALANRPLTRADCETGPRPCPWAACRHHLAYEVTEAGGLKIVNPDREPTETCALDVSVRGEQTLQTIAELLNLTRERVRQIEITALHKMKRNT